MPRGIRKSKPIANAAPSIQDRIRDAERQVAAGLKESVVVDPGTLERVLELVISTGQTKAQILKKAVVLGLDVLSFKPEPKKNPYKPGEIIEVADIEDFTPAVFEQEYTLRRGHTRYPESVAVETPEHVPVEVPPDTVPF